MPSRPPARGTRSAHWQTLEALAIDYLSEPRPMEGQPESPERSALRAKILQRLTRSMVDAALLPEQTPGHWRDGELEKLIRFEARRLGRVAEMKDAMGGTAALVEEAAQELWLARGQRPAGDATLLSGLLGQWRPERGSLSTLLSQLVRSHLLDMAKRYHAEQGLSPVSAADRLSVVLQDGPDDDGHGALDRLADPGSAGRELEAALYDAIEALPTALREMVCVQLQGGSRDEELAAVGVRSAATLDSRREQVIALLREGVQARHLMTQWLDRLAQG